jgi:Sec-independent protein translocase protein TatA
LEEKCYVLQNKQVKADNNLRKLIENQHVAEREIQTLVKKNDAQRLAIDSLQDKCKSLEEAQSTDRENINGKIDATDNNVRTNQDQLQSRTLYGVIVVIVVLVIIVGVACWLTKRIKSGTSTIGDVRRAQEALQAAQTKMQEESVKLDNQLLAIVQKQLDASSASKITGEPDHSLVVKLADEIARIETNLSKMDKSVRGYKQLVQAKDRMINNVRANGYEIISLLGQEYNDGMQFQTRFVPDESLPEGKRIITGMIKMQVNYNGKMIQPAEIVVSQNI